MHIPDDHIYQEAHLSPMTVAEINQLIENVRALPPSGFNCKCTHII